jgi:hypothetical protein
MKGKDGHACKMRFKASAELNGRMFIKVEEINFKSLTIYGVPSTFGNTYGDEGTGEAIKTYDTYGNGTL